MINPATNILLYVLLHVLKAGLTRCPQFYLFRGRATAAQ